MKLSYTALKTFQQCHFRYHLRYDRGLTSRPHRRHSPPVLCTARCISSIKA